MNLKEVNLLFPHQLFNSGEFLESKSPIYLIEEYLFFTQYAFHKQKILFHRASMKNYEIKLRERGLIVEYIEALLPEHDIRLLLPKLKANGVNSINIIDPVDMYLKKRIQTGCENLNIHLTINESPSFINSEELNKTFFKSSKKKFYQSKFYKDQRLFHNILIDKDAKPLGGKWSFDTDNRKKYPANQKPPKIKTLQTCDVYKDAYDYTKSNYQKNPGTIEKIPRYPYTHEDADLWLDDFLENRFQEFGIYEDAILKNQSTLHHSLLSPLLNSGLLEPNKVINKILNHAEKNCVPINSTEGIIRQLIGWREFIRGIYEVKGNEERTKNFWNFKKSMPSHFYDATTGIEPIDNTIKGVLETGYCHHIERLMILGNFMLLCEIDPDDVYKWFMELFIDAYDWVMVPNIYGMSQFADGGLMSSKPYISSSNYLIKMSNYEKGDWQKTWDGLFWRFMNKQRDFFLKNPRLSMLIHTYDKMDQTKKQEHQTNASNYLDQLEKGSVTSFEL